MAVLPVAPVANTVPSGRNTAGPISWEPPPFEVRSGSFTMVLPALDHAPDDGPYFSAWVRLRVLLQSTVSTRPLGSSVQPSSSFSSILPVPVVVQVSVVGFSRACWVEQ